MEFKVHLALMDGDEVGWWANAGCLFSWPPFDWYVLNVDIILCVWFASPLNRKKTQIKGNIIEANSLDAAFIFLGSFC